MRRAGEEWAAASAAAVAGAATVVAIVVCGGWSACVEERADPSGRCRSERNLVGRPWWSDWAGDAE